jgi:hypothetical protein
MQALDVVELRELTNSLDNLVSTVLGSVQDFREHSLVLRELLPVLERTYGSLDMLRIHELSQGGEGRGDFEPCIASVEANRERVRQAIDALDS